MEAMFQPYLRYFEFSGRSTRTEFWLFNLFFWVVTVILFILGGGVDTLLVDEPAGTFDAAGMGMAFMIFSLFMLVTFIPMLTVSVRRFHDAGFSGWVYLGLSLLSAIPLIGILFSLAMLVLLVLPSAPTNKWGDNPHDGWERDSNYGYHTPEAARRPEGVRYR